MRFRHGKLSPVLRYAAFLFYVAVILLAGAYFLRGSFGGGGFSYSSARVYSREELPKVVRDFEDLVVPGLGAGGRGVSVPGEQSQDDIKAQLKKYSYNK